MQDAGYEADCKTARLQDCKTAKLQNCKTAKLQNFSPNYVISFG
jgi:hypothetical protein